MLGFKTGRLKIAGVCLFIGLLLTFLYVLSIDAHKPENGASKIARLVKAVQVETADAASNRKFPGIVQADYETDLAFRVGGPMTLLNVKIGQKVAPGDVIARIDPRDYLVAVKRLEAAVSQAKANFQAMRRGARREDIARMEAELTASRAQLDEAKSNYSRFSALYREKAVAKATFDTAKTAFENAQARVTATAKALEIGKAGARQEDLDAMQAQIRLLKADLESAKNALADTELRAPIHGLINKKYVDNFETVGAGQSIVSLLDLSSVQVKTGIPQSMVARHAQWTRFTVTLDAYPGVAIPAELKEIGQKTEGPGMSYPLIVHLDLPEKMIALPGMAAEVAIVAAHSQNEKGGMVLPNTALFADKEGRSWVWTIDNKTMIIHKTPVILGEMMENGVLIKEGLTAGDLVVGAGARLLMDGEKVRLANRSEGDIQ